MDIYEDKSQSKLFTLKRILIITRGSRNEIRNPTFGGPRLVKELYEQLTTKGFKVSVLSVFDLSALSAHLLRIRGKDASRPRTSFLSATKLRWFLNLLYSLIAEIASRIDIKLRKEVEKRIDEMKPDIILYDGPIGAFAFLNTAKKRSIPFVLCEHNVDYYFYEDKLGHNPLINMYKAIELSVCKAADLVICFNPYDRERLVKDNISSEKIIVWKFNIRAKRNYDKEKVLNKIPLDIRSRIENKFVVGFLGANYTLNIIAVKYILKISEKLPKDIVFLIIGSVTEAFKGVKVPSNVIFTGYVENVKPYLAITNVLLNLKFTSDTGIEAKMLDYLSYGKLIISTRIGAVGFEHFPNIIIVDNLKDAVHEIVRLYREWSVKIKSKTRGSALMGRDLDGEI